ncbi:hypothetical protein RIF29_19457 [Crotalaria pallida]|uniref:Uroporphyrinogen-III synthase n=1 Tax=Crotalaria pallida TaxID=3830 RepID=A0AAN9IBF1_CROPI
MVHVICCNSAWKNLLSDLEWSNSIACIGETTVATARSLGFRNVYYPTQPGLEGISSMTHRKCLFPHGLKSPMDA